MRFVVFQTSNSYRNIIMGLRFLIIASFIAGLIASISAHAATVNLTGDHYTFDDMVVGGQTGSITTTEIKDTGNKRWYAYAKGVLAPHTQLLFTFTTTKDRGYAVAHSTVPYLSETVTAQGSGGSPSVLSTNSLVRVTASCVSDCGATSSIINYSDTTVDFYTYIFDKKGNSITATYIASTIPLPAAVFLFGSGLAGVFACARRRANAI